MSQEERFKQIIATAQEEAKLKDLTKLADDAWWAEIRDELITPVLIDAAQALKGSVGLWGEQLPMNHGGGAMLKAGTPPSDTDHYIAFKLEILPGRFPGLKEVGIQVASSESDLAERWDRPWVTVKEIINKVDSFLKAVASKNPPPKLQSGIR